MSESVSPTKTTPPYPNTNSINVNPTFSMDLENSPPMSSASSTASSSSESEFHTQPVRPTSSRKTRMERPKMMERQRSASIIVPKGTENIQREKPYYPPTDARGMSPRRSSIDVQKMEQNARRSLQDQARTLQSSLAALAERIDEVRFDHDKLESENKFLQDYIGGLTRSMSGAGLGRSGSTAKKSKK